MNRSIKIHQVALVNLTGHDISFQMDPEGAIITVPRLPARFEGERVKIELTQQVLDTDTVIGRISSNVVKAVLFPTHCQRLSDAADSENGEGFIVRSQTGENILVMFIVGRMVLDHVESDSNYYWLRPFILAPDSGTTSVRTVKGHVLYVTGWIKASGCVLTERAHEFVDLDFDEYKGLTPTSSEPWLL